MASDVRLLVTPGVSSVSVQQADGNLAGIALRSTRDGAIINQTWIQSMVNAGYGFGANFGVGTTLVTGSVGYAIATPHMNLDVPSGKTIIPFFATTYLQTSAGTITSVIYAVSNALMGTGTAAAASTLPTNLRTDRLNASTVTARQAYTAGGAVVAANQLELVHAGYPFADAAGSPIKQFLWDGNNTTYPVIVGPGSFQAYWYATATAPTGKGQIYWVEIPSNWIV